MGLTVNLPSRLIRGKSAFTAEWGNSIREAIHRLAKQQPPLQHHPMGEQKFLPFEPVLWWDDSDRKAFFTPANLVIFRTGIPLPVTIGGASMADSPGVDATAGDVWYCKVNTSNIGVPSSADLQVSVSTPTNIQFAEPLDGGSGTLGEYWFKIAEFIDDAGELTLEQHHTGDIDWHTRPWKNIGNYAEVAKQFATDIYEMRTLKPLGSEPSGDDVYDVYVKPDQKTSTIDFYGKVDLSGFRPSHPWKATGNGTGNIAVAAGKVMFPINNGGSPSDPMPIVYDYVSYAGGNIGVGADGFIYVKCTITASQDVAGVEGLSITQVSPDPDIASIKLEVESVSSVSVVFSADAPSAYDPADGNLYYPIAEVSEAAGVASVDDQILTHNPTHGLTTVLSVS